MGTIKKEVGPRRKCGPAQHGDRLSGAWRPTGRLGTVCPRHYCGKQMDAEEKEREKQNGLCPVDTGESEEVKVMKSGLRWVAGLLLRAMVTSRLGLLLGPKSGFMALDRAAACVDVCDSWYQEDGGCTELALSLIGCNTGENLSWSVPAAALRREASTPHRGNTVKLRAIPESVKAGELVPPLVHCRTE